MQKILFFLFIVLCGEAFSQMPICNLPQTNTGTVHDWIIIEDSACGTLPGRGTYRIKMSDFLSVYGIGAAGTNPTGAAGGDLSGTYPNPVVSQASSKFSFVSDITPATLAAGQDNYSPTGMATANRIYQNSTTDIAITGFALGTAGKVIFYFNISTFGHLFVNSSTSSASNQFKLNGDLLLSAGQGAIFMYDENASRWRCAAVSTTGMGSAGTVTSFGFTNSTGIAGTVSNPTTTPNLSLTIKDSAISITAGSTTKNATTSAHGFLRQLNNVSTQYMNGQGNWTTPAGTGANVNLSNLSSVAINTALIPQTSIDLGSLTAPFRHLYLYGDGTYSTTSMKFNGTPTAARTITFPDSSFTVAMSNKAQTFSAINTFSVNQYFNSRVGIGTTSPATNLHLNGTARFQSLGSVSNDTTTYKPLGIDATGNLISMYRWVGTGVGGGVDVTAWHHAGDSMSTVERYLSTRSATPLTITANNSTLSRAPSVGTFIHFPVAGELTINSKNYINIDCNSGQKFVGIYTPRLVHTGSNIQLTSFANSNIRDTLQFYIPENTKSVNMMAPDTIRGSSYTIVLPDSAPKINTFLHALGGNLFRWDTVSGGGGSGTVQSFSSGNLVPLFTTSVATATTNPSQTFALSNAAAGTVYTNSTGATATPNFSSNVQLGKVGTNTGSLSLCGATSGTISIAPQTIAGTYGFNLPITAGTAGQFLTSQGGGSNAMTWTTAGGGGGTMTKQQILDTLNNSIPDTILLNKPIRGNGRNIFDSLSIGTNAAPNFRLDVKGLSKFDGGLYTENGNVIINNPSAASTQVLTTGGGGAGAWLADFGGAVGSGVYEGNDLFPIATFVQNTASYYFGGEYGLHWASGGEMIYDGVQGVDPKGVVLKQQLSDTIAITMIIDGGDSTIRTGIKGDIEVPMGATLIRKTLLCDAVGSMNLDIFMSTYSAYPPTAGGINVTSSAVEKYQAATSLVVPSGNILRFKVQTVSTYKRCTVSLKAVIPK